MNNKKIGNEYEEKFIEYLKENGYWCHRIAYNPLGQPCDIIAIQNDIAVLIDVKHCNGNRFSFDNIQENQINSFELALRKDNHYSCFVIYSEVYKKFFMLTYRMFKGYRNNGIKSLKVEELQNVDGWFKI